MASAKKKVEVVAEPTIADSGPFVKYKGSLPLRGICDSDNHFPIHDPYVQAAKMRFAADFKPDLWMNIGDQYDFHSVSNFPKDPERMFRGAFTLQDEFDSANAYWREVCSVTKKDVIFIQGNHEVRLAKQISAVPGLFGLNGLDFKRLASLPERIQVFQHGKLFQIGQLTFQHGDSIGGRFGSKNPATYVQNTNMAGNSTIFGHYHRSQQVTTTFWDANGPRHVTVTAQGHGSNVEKAGYVKTPNWNHGFSVFEIRKDGFPHVTNIIIDNGKFSYGGVEYDGRKV